MRAVRTIVAVMFAATIAVTGCTTHSSTDRPSPAPPAPDTTHAFKAPTHRPDTTNLNPVDRRTSIYAAVLRQYLTSGDHSFGRHRFPRIFVLDRAVAGTGAHTRVAAGGDEPIPPAVQRAITQALIDVGPLTFVASPKAVIEEPDGCAHVRDEGILITLAPLIGVGDRVEVGINGFVACLGASSVTYALERTQAGWVVHDTTLGAVS
jgi:hypothetical protein